MVAPVAAGAASGAANGFDFESILKLIQGAESGSEEAADFSGFDFPDLISQIIAPSAVKKSSSEFGKLQGAASERQSLLGMLATLSVLDNFGSIFADTDPEVIKTILTPQQTRKPEAPPKKKRSSSSGVANERQFGGRR